MQVHVLQVPDALVEWGKRDEVALAFGAPWAHDIESLVEQARERPLRPRETDRLLSRIEGLVTEAIRAGRNDLLLGFDMLTAEWLDMTFRFRASDGREVELGRRARWNYAEMRALLQHEEASQAVPVCEQVKDLLADAFPGARIGAIIDRAKTPPPPCSGCGTTEATVMLTSESGSDYCRSCWGYLTSDWPKFDGRGKRIR